MSHQEWIDLLIKYGVKIGLAILIFIVGRLLAKLLASVSKKLMTKKGMDAAAVSFIGRIVYAVILVFTLIAVLNQVGIETTSLVAVLGAAGLAIGLALQGSLSNFAAGFLIIVLKPFRAGDYVEGAGVAGSIEEVGMFSTEMKTVDNKKVFIPNAKLLGDNIINYSAKKTRRVDFKLGVGYDDDLAKVKKVIGEVIKMQDNLLTDPEPFIGLSELGDSSVNFAVRVWCNTPDYWAVYFKMMEDFKIEFDKNGISIPFPQRDVHLHQVEK